MKPDIVELREVAEVGPRGEPLSAEAPFVPMDAVTVGLRFPTYTELRGKRGGVRAKAHDVLFARITPCLENGKVAQLPADAPPTGGSTEFLVLRPGPELDPAFLYYWSLAPGTRTNAQAKMTGTTGRMRLSGKVLETFPIPLFSRGKQRRIVEILEDHLSHLALAARGVQTSLLRLEVLDRSLHQAALRGSLVPDDLSEGTGADLIGNHHPDDVSVIEERTWLVPPSWVWTRVGDLFSVAVGATPSRSDATLWSGSVPWVSSGEVAFNRIRSTRESITEEAAGNLARRIHPPGTVMVAMIGEGKTRGQAAILDVAAAHNQNCASIRVSETAVLPEYVYAFFKERYLETRRASSGGNQPALNKGRVQAIPMPVPPLGTQRRIVAELERLGGLIGHARAECQTQLLRADSLRRAVLAAAFEGKLTGRHTDQEVIEEWAEA